MMTTIALAITVAFVFSWVVAVAPWWELATLVTVMLRRHGNEMRSIRPAHGALKELTK
jgi:Cu2+-exporting ATPase